MGCTAFASVFPLLLLLDLQPGDLTQSLYNGAALNFNLSPLVALLPHTTRALLQCGG